MDHSNCGLRTTVENLVVFAHGMCATRFGFCEKACN